MKPANPLLVGVSVVSLFGGSIGAWNGARAVFEHLADQRMQRLLTIERLNKLEVQVCELQGGRWFQGDCNPTEEAPR